MRLTTDNRSSQIAEDYFDEIQALRARMRQLQSENVALKLENRELRAAAGTGAQRPAHAYTDYRMFRMADKDRAA
jgi:regulator of replication initiation timing